MTAESEALQLLDSAVDDELAEVSSAAILSMLSRRYAEATENGTQPAAMCVSSLFLDFFERPRSSEIESCELAEETKMLV